MLISGVIYQLLTKFISFIHKTIQITFIHYSLIYQAIIKA